MKTKRRHSQHRSERQADSSGNVSLLHPRSQPEKEDTVKKDNRCPDVFWLFVDFSTPSIFFSIKRDILLSIHQLNTFFDWQSHLCQRLFAIKQQKFQEYLRLYKHLSEASFSSLPSCGFDSQDDGNIPTDRVDRDSVSICRR